MPRLGDSPHRPSQTVAVGFLVSAILICVAALLIPGLVRPDPWRTAFVVLTGAAVAGIPLVALLRSLIGPVAVVAVLAADGGIALGGFAVTQNTSCLAVGLFALPTVFVALFMNRLVFVALQAPLAVVGVLVVLWRAGERGAVLGLHATIALVAVLLPAVALLVLRGRLVSALERERELAATDPLTGLANRRGLAMRAPLVAGHARRQNVDLCVITVDLDHFKRVNDTHGHRVGDSVLLRVSRTLQQDTRAVDIVARLGGEEFAVLSAMTPADAYAQAERLRQQLQQVCADVAVTGSLGLATAWPPGDDQALEQLLWNLVDRADDFMYVAKGLGRNRVVGPPGVDGTRSARAAVSAGSARVGRRSSPDRSAGTGGTPPASR